MAEPLCLRDGAHDTRLVEPLLKALLGGSGQNVAFALPASDIGSVQGDVVLSFNLLSLCLDHVIDDLQARFALDGLSHPCHTFRPQCIT